MYLQVLPNQKLKALKERQFQTVVSLQSRRGAILDRNNRELAISTSAYSLFADPKIIEAPRYTARKLAKVLGTSSEFIFSKIKDKKKRFVWIQRQLSPDVMLKVKDLNIRGLAFVDEFKRIYPNDALLAHSLGVVGAEGQGLEGIELFYDQQMRGNKKNISLKRDARGRPLIVDGLMFADNPEGSEITLTIDSEIQHMMQKELAQAVVEYEADQAFGVVLDAQTSEIVAIGSTPFFDANGAGKVDSTARRNRAVTDVFEPGSTLKTFVVAAALKNKILAPNKKYNTENGKFQVGDKIIREAEANHKWQTLTASEILAYSSNIGTAKIALELGAENLRTALQDFGFGEKTGVDLPGESKGILHGLPWRPHLLSNISFGHGVSVTALQIANAYAAVANGGKLHKPYIVKSIKDAHNSQITEIKPQMIKKVLTDDESAQMRLMLMSVTSSGGTGTRANVDGFLVGGKTGTAQKVNPDGKGYLDKAYLSSFAGFIPAVDPKYVIFVAVDYPKKNAYYGSQVAAPIFSRIASYAARKAGLAPVLLSEKNIIHKKTEDNKISKNNATFVLSEILDLPELEKIETVPDLFHLSLREAIRKIHGHDIQLRIKGQGAVVEMDPQPGSPLPTDKKITIILK